MKRIAKQLLASVSLLLTILFHQNILAQTNVVLAGTFQSELGCPGDWQPWCDATALTYNAGTGLWSGTFAIDTGHWQYKVAYNGSWDESYGAGGGPDNISLYVPVKSNITFVYNPNTHLVTSSGIPPKEVQLFGEFQSELGCSSDWQWACSSAGLVFNKTSGLWEGTFTLPAGCYKYQVKETPESGSPVLYGAEGSTAGKYLQLYIPSSGAVSFAYDASTHLVTTSPYGAPAPGVRVVSLYGTLQDEIGCSTDWQYFCDRSALTLNTATGKWEGKFNLPAGCYMYQVKEEWGCNDNTVFYGEGGQAGGAYIQLAVPTAAEVSFSYDPKSHIVSSAPYGAPQVSVVALVGDLQSELGCPADGYPECTNSQLVFNKTTGVWEGKFTLPAGCYNYTVLEGNDCGRLYYGKGGVKYGDSYQLYVASKGEVSFTYNPLTHTLVTSPAGMPPQGNTRVSLLGSLQSELGCPGDFDYNCETAALSLNTATGKWQGTFTLPAGCYAYQVKEVFGCSTVTVYGDGGGQWGPEIQLYVPQSGAVTFTYDPQTHITTSTPYSGVPKDLLTISLLGDLQSKAGCTTDFEDQCNKPSLTYNGVTGKWEGQVTLPAGCYSFMVKETTGCNNTALYGEKGMQWGNLIPLFVPVTATITFSYDQQTHLISTTPYSGASQELTSVSLYGSLQSEAGCSTDYDYMCTKAALAYSEASGKWEGKFLLPEGCYSFQVKEVRGCNNVMMYGEEGLTYGSDIQLYVPQKGEVTFVYDSATHRITMSPYGAPKEVTRVSLMGDLQSEAGCTGDYTYDCDLPALTYNATSGKWEGKVTLPAGCYSYRVKETVGCNNINFYGQNGLPYGDPIQLSVPEKAEVTFIYDAQTHTITSTPYGASTVTAVSLVGDLQSGLGCTINWDYTGCAKTALTYNAKSGLWEGTFSLEPGCYKYVVKQVKGCGTIEVYGQNGKDGGYEYYNYYLMYVPEKASVVVTYDPATHLATSTYNNICPSTTVVIAGDFQSELGCLPVTGVGGDWEPACDKTRLTYDAAAKVWTGTWDLPAGHWQYKAVLNNSWTESYGQGGSPEAYNNIHLDLEAPANITFIYHPVTHLIDLVYNTVDLCLTAYYDANANGLKDPDENIPMEGVAFTLSNGTTQYTGSDGRACFAKLTPGAYTFSETAPAGYLPTLGVQHVNLAKPLSLNLATAACLGGAGAHTLSFWMNKGGQALMEALPGVQAAAVLDTLRLLNLRNADGTNFDPQTFDQLGVWLQKANAKNMAYKLSAEMAVLYLNVRLGMLGNRSVYTPGITYGGQQRDFMNVYLLIWQVNQQLTANAYGGDDNRVALEHLRKLLEELNADNGFVQLQPCGSPVVTLGKTGRATPVRETAGTAVVWPNPSEGYFTLRPANSSSDAPLLVRVTDASGKVLYTATGPAGKEYRFGESFRAGMYFVEVIQAGKRSALKVVKQ